MHKTVANRLTGLTQVDTTAHPLTHHEILGLIEPFARAGRHVDLAASDRIKRCLVFKPIEHAGVIHPLDGAREAVRLENPRLGLYRLTRDLTLSSGLKATLLTEGPHPRDLLPRIDTVPPRQQIRLATGVVIAFSYRLAPAADALHPVRMVLTRAEARVDGLILTLNDTTVANYPAKIDLVPEAGYSFDLPEDLLAVLGREWGLLRRCGTGWSSTLRVRGKVFDRSRQIEIALERLVAHLTTTLARPPIHFHQTLLRARWRVVLRRSSPLMVFFALIAAIGVLSRFEVPPDSVIRLLPAVMPALLMVIAFTMRDRPPIEFPPLPRCSRATTWRQAPAVE